jgi:hypothetical protein
MIQKRNSCTHAGGGGIKAQQNQSIKMTKIRRDVCRVYLIPDNADEQQICQSGRNRSQKAGLGDWIATPKALAPLHYGTHRCSRCCRPQFYTSHVLPSIYTCRYTSETSHGHSIRSRRGNVRFSGGCSGRVQTWRVYRRNGRPK